MEHGTEKGSSGTDWVTGEPGPAEDPEEIDPVEERVADWGRRVGRFFATAAARAREEAEDIVAEAQILRRGDEE